MSSHLPRKRVEADILAKIASGEYAPGSMLPSVRTLAEHYGISPATVAKAIQPLARDGVLETEPGYGVFVSDSPEIDQHYNREAATRAEKQRERDDRRRVTEEYRARKAAEARRRRADPEYRERENTAARMRQATTPRPKQLTSPVLKDAFDHYQGQRKRDASSIPAVRVRLEREQKRREQKQADQAEAARVAAAREAVQESMRETLRLADEVGLSYKEIAERQGTTIGTVMSRLYRERRKANPDYKARQKPTTRTARKRAQKAAEKALARAEREAESELLRPEREEKRKEYMRKYAKDRYAKEHGKELVA